MVTILLFLKHHMFCKVSVYLLTNINFCTKTLKTSTMNKRTFSRNNYFCTICAGTLAFEILWLIIVAMLLYRRYIITLIICLWYHRRWDFLLERWFIQVTINTSFFFFLLRITSLIFCWFYSRKVNYLFLVIVRLINCLWNCHCNVCIMPGKGKI